MSGIFEGESATLMSKYMMLTMGALTTLCLYQSYKDRQEKRALQKKLRKYKNKIKALPVQDGLSQVINEFSTKLKELFKQTKDNNNTTKCSSEGCVESATTDF